MAVSGGALWSQRWLFLTFLKRDVSSRYSGTLGGGLWALAQPVLLLAIYSFVFRKVFKVAFPELGAHSFTTFVACALWPWMAFQEAVQRGTQAITGNAGIVKKVMFSHELLVLAAVSSTFLIHFTGYIVVLIAMSIFGEQFSLSGLPMLLAGWLILLVMATSVALITSAFQVFLKDIDHLLGPVFMILFYVTPILYPLSQVPEAVRLPMAFNPVVHVIDPMRAAIMNGVASGDAAKFVLVFGVSVCFLMFARVLFNRLSPSFEDFL